MDTTTCISTWTSLIQQFFSAFHRCGRKVFGAGWWRDVVRSTRKRTVYAWGLGLVILTLRVYPPWGGESACGGPILMRLHRKGGDSLIDLAQKMLKQVAAWLPKGHTSVPLRWRYLNCLKPPNILTSNKSPSS